MLIALALYIASFYVNSTMFFTSITIFFSLLLRYFSVNWKMYSVMCVLMFSFNNFHKLDEKSCGIVISVNEKSFSMLTTGHTATVVTENNLELDMFICVEGKYEANIETSKRNFQTYFYPRIKVKTHIPSIRRWLWKYSEFLDEKRNVLFSKNDESSSLIASHSWYLVGFIECVIWILKPKIGTKKLLQFKKVFISLYFILIAQNIALFRVLLALFFPVEVQIVTILVMFPKLNTSTFFMLVYGTALISSLNSKFEKKSLILRALLVSYTINKLSIFELVTMKYLRYYAGIIFFMTVVSLFLKTSVYNVNFIDSIFLGLSNNDLTLLGKVPMLVIIVYLLIYLVSKKSALVWVSLSYLFISLSPFDKVVFIDVGQGDATLIKTSFNKDVTLIDTGKPNAKFSLVKSLKAHGVQRIDTLFITHGDLDHSGNETEIVNSYFPSKVIKEKNFSVGGFREYLSEKDFDGINDNSLILKSQFDILFTGDASSLQEYLLSKDVTIPSKILKLGHHGSKTSSDYNFLKHVNPSMAIISSDPRVYGHPHQEVLKNLYDLRIDYLETSKEGNITVYFIGPFSLFITSNGLFGFIY